MAGLPVEKRGTSKSALAQKARAEWADKCRAIFERDGWPPTSPPSGRPWFDYIRFMCPRCGYKANGHALYTLYYGSIQAKVRHEEWHDKGAKPPLKTWDPKMKWNIDKMLVKLETPSKYEVFKGEPGTVMKRIYFSLEAMARENVTPTLEQKGAGGGVVWLLSLGGADLFSLGTGPANPGDRANFFGHELRECFLKARRAAKLGKLEAVVPGARARFAAKGRGPVSKRRRQEPPTRHATE